MEIKLVDIKKDEEHNVIIGHTHFIKTIEDVYEALVTSVPGIKFGVAFCEASQKRLIRHSGTDEALEKLAIENAERIGAGHTFVIILGNAYPINVMKDLKSVDEIVSIYCATANPVKVVVAEEGEQRAVIGVMDGLTPLGVEGEEDIKERKEFLRKIGYKQ
ncbi:adenosine monophosphate-protein transferase [bacterium]|uniref:Adenosine monophosphate-protein transferase n=1 Tax=candidate division WOR-3 bacterium TaxID=2052148 RepID=A0A7C0ZC71_UNCW3|nr:MAG: adenosine monophosphate-protein transferase [bacterium]HDI82239.1 adenosine monophosphate-protein transferase [candidate division WOR-3 bacterium]